MTKKIYLETLKSALGRSILKYRRLVEVTSAKNENKHKCSSWTLYIVLFSMFFTINVGIGSFFLYFHWYLKKDVASVKFGTPPQTTI